MPWPVSPVCEAQFKNEKNAISASHIRLLGLVYLQETSSGVENSNHLHLHQGWTVVFSRGLDGLFRINQGPENLTVRSVIKKQLNGYQLFVLLQHIS
jgi:hypothetical protein